MPKVKVDLASVSSHSGCKKPECPYNAQLDRHHMGHQSMWVSLFARRSKEKRYQEFVARYYEFHHEDIVELCCHHHAEIHQLYDAKIQRSMQTHQKLLSDYSWNEAEALMRSLITLCRRWLSSPTPGIDSEAFSRNRQTRKRPKL